MLTCAKLAAYDLNILLGLLVPVSCDKSKSQRSRTYTPVSCRTTHLPRGGRLLEDEHARRPIVLVLVTLGGTNGKVGMRRSGRR